MKETINPKLLGFNQKIGWLVLRPFLKFIIQYRSCIKCDASDLKKPLIIASNHISFIDAPILGTILPFSCQAYPSYFIAKDTLLAVPLIGGFLKFFGAFRAHRGEGMEKSLQEPEQILKNNCSVVFFPQGKRYNDFLLEQGKPGTAILALRTNVPILPVAICGIKNYSWKNFFLRKYKVQVVVGQPFLLKEKLDQYYTPNNAEVGTQIIMQEIKKLIDFNSELPAPNTGK